MLDRRTLIAATLGVSAVPFAAFSAPLTQPIRASGVADPLGVRGDFPTTGTDTIFLNSALQSLIPRQVIAAGLAMLEQKSVAPVGSDDLSRPTRAGFARLINATPEEIALLHSTGEGQNVVVRGLQLKPGDNVLMSSLNYDTDFILYRALVAELGIELRIVPHRNGAVEAQDFERLIDKRTRLLTIALVSHQNGYLHDVKAIATVAHAHGAYLYADAIQAAGSVRIDVRDSNIDFLNANGYKWMLGLAGAAPLYIRRDLIERLKLDRYGEGQISRRLGHRQYEFYNDARKFEVSASRPGAVTELAAGLAYIESVGLPRIEAHTVGLGLKLQYALLSQGHQLFTPEGNRTPIVAFYASRPSDEIKARFAAANIQITARDGTVRISPALFNTEAEIDHCLDVTKTIV